MTAIGNRIFAAGLLLAAALLAANFATAGPAPAAPGVTGIIVKFKAASPLRRRALSAADAAELATTAGMPIAAARAMSGSRQVLRLESTISRTEAEAVAARLSLHPDVEYAVADGRKVPHLTPNDELFGFQWNYTDAIAGIDLSPAWDITTGTTSVVIAIVDTGSRPHPDAGISLPGYNFISDAFTANGDGRGPDPTDTGDGVSAADVASHPDLTPSTSSWHGEAVAGLAGAISNNGFGIAGVDWNARLVHARVLGKGGGIDSDILDGINWVAGMHVPGVPDNPNPAQIINLSLGGGGACDAAYQDTFDTLIAAGKVIVVSAGNDGADVANTSPANCMGVITVAATARTGARASYSNFGSAPGAIALAAPGGDGAMTDQILSLSNLGQYAPGVESYAWKQGTSFAAPQVSAVAALMLSVNPGLAPSQVAQILRNTSRGFPAGTGDDCLPVRCGAGLLDAYAAVLFARQMAAPALAPQAGWWASPNMSGVGFTIEVQGNHLLMGSYLYDDSGKSIWYAAGPGAINGETYLGSLMFYGGGQTLTGSYRPASFAGTAGDVALSFASPTQGTLTWPGGTLAIQRYDFGPGGASATPPAGTPEAGWWWAPSEGGRGYAIEVQGGTMLIAGYMYDTLGNPVWYLSGPAPMTDASTYQGQWQLYANGPSLTGSPRTPQLFNASAGALVIQFTSNTTANLTLPDGRQVAIQRYRY
jgi:subtilisin family serine protease